MGDIPKELKVSLIQADIAEWERVKYSSELRLRVHARLKASGLASEEQVKAFQEEVVRCEAALEELGKALKELDGNSSGK